MQTNRRVIRILRPDLSALAGQMEMLEEDAASGVRARIKTLRDKAAEMEDGELKQDLVNMIASFMYNSCKAWNNENLSNEVIAEHLKTLSKGQLKIEGSELVVSADTTINVRKQMPQKSHNFGRNNKNKNNKNRGKNFRRF